MLKNTIHIFDMYMIKLATVLLAIQIFSYEQVHMCIYGLHPFWNECFDRLIFWKYFSMDFVSKIVVV